MLSAFRNILRSTPQRTSQNIFRPPGNIIPRGRTICHCLCSESLDSEKCKLYDDALAKKNNLTAEDFINKGFAHLTLYDEGKERITTEYIKSLFHRAIHLDTSGKHQKTIQCGLYQLHGTSLSRYCAVKNNT